MVKKTPKTQKSPVSFRMPDAEEKRLRAEAKKAGLSLKAYLNMIIQKSWNPPEKQGEEHQISTKKVDETSQEPAIKPPIQQQNLDLTRQPPPNQGQTWPATQPQQLAWGQQMPPPQTIVKSYRDMTDLEFFQSFLEQYQLNKRTIQILLDQCRIHGLPNPLNFNRTLHGISGIKSAQTTNMISELYSDALQQYRLAKNVHQDFMRRQGGFQAGMSPYPSQPYDRSREKDLEKKLEEATKQITELKEAARDKRLEEIAQFMFQL